MQPDLDIPTLRRLAEEGTPSKFTVAGHNAALIVAAVNALPALLDRIERAEKQLRKIADSDYPNRQATIHAYPVFTHES